MGSSAGSKSVYGFVQQCKLRLASSGEEGSPQPNSSCLSPQEETSSTILEGLSNFSRQLFFRRPIITAGAPPIPQLLRNNPQLLRVARLPFFAVHQKIIPSVDAKFFRQRAALYTKRRRASKALAKTEGVLTALAEELSQDTSVNGELSSLLAEALEKKASAEKRLLAINEELKQLRR